MYKTDQDRFQEKIHISSPDDCWEWKAGRDKNGYGKFKLNGRSMRAPRIAYAWHHSVNVDSLDIVRHHCDNPPCCNPAHLYHGTTQDNVDDRMQRGRDASRAGKENGQAKLTNDQVMEIRRELTAGEIQRVLARKFNVCQATISKIARGERWMHLPHIPIHRRAGYLKRPSSHE